MWLSVPSVQSFDSDGWAIVRAAERHLAFKLFFINVE